MSRNPAHDCPDSAVDGAVRMLSPSTVQLMTSLGMIQRRDLGAITNVQQLARQMVYQALVHPEK